MKWFVNTIIQSPRETMPKNPSTQFDFTLYDYLAHDQRLKRLNHRIESLERTKRATHQTLVYGMFKVV